MNKKKSQSKFNLHSFRKGMTYVELAVVLSIFAVMASVVFFDYNKFQSRVDIKVLANDIALKIVESSKSALSGKMPNRTYGATWKPFYGIYFSTNTLNEKKSIVHFVDLNSSGDYTASSNCPGVSGGSDECLDKISITKGNYISKIEKYLGVTPTQISSLSISYKRPDSSPIFKSDGTLLANFDYVQVTIVSPSAVESYIKIYPSGRVQII